MSGIIGGTGGGACPGCGQYGNACKCHERAEKQAADMAQVAVLEKTEASLVGQLLAVRQEINRFKVKCPTCRCRIFPWAACGCCNDPMCEADRP